MNETICLAPFTLVGKAVFSLFCKEVAGMGLAGYSLKQRQSTTKKKYEDPVSLHQGRDFSRQGVTPTCQLKPFRRPGFIVSVPDMAEGSPSPWCQGHHFISEGGYLTRKRS